MVELEKVRRVLDYAPPEKTPRGLYYDALNRRLNREVLVRRLETRAARDEALLVVPPEEWDAALAAAQRERQLSTDLGSTREELATMQARQAQLQEEIDALKSRAVAVPEPTPFVDLPPPEPVMPAEPTPELAPEPATGTLVEEWRQADVEIQPPTAEELEAQGWQVMARGRPVITFEPVEQMEPSEAPTVPAESGRERARREKREAKEAKRLAKEQEKEAKRLAKLEASAPAPAADESVVEEAPPEEAPAEDVPAEATEEIPTEEAQVEEAPTEEIVAEDEAPAEEGPAVEEEPGPDPRLQQMETQIANSERELDKVESELHRLEEKEKKLEAIIGTGPYTFRGYTLYVRYSGRGKARRPFYFFSKGKPATGQKTTKPRGFYVIVNERNRLPMLKAGSPARRASRRRK